MPTKNKSRKVKTLRNNEYYDFQEIQDKLYMDSKNNKIFKNLVEIITLDENIKLAYRNIKNNSGSNTAGTDNKRFIKNSSYKINRNCEGKTTMV